MKVAVNPVFHAWQYVAKVLDWLAPLAFLLLRVWVAWAFFKSGYLKITSWDTTLYLFENEYAVPLLSPLYAAYLGTFIELVMPVLLVIGLLARPAALLLFMFNIMAVISYPDLDPAAATDHQAWGVVLLLLATAGVGRWSCDQWSSRRIKAFAI
ncbi:MAG: DoxX family protein [Gammaproteobacteria bacterium]|nr:DoxX family protein [Gammaproteobacteria bacterium]